MHIACSFYISIFQRQSPKELKKFVHFAKLTGKEVSAYNPYIRRVRAMEGMTGKEILNLIDWLKNQGFDNDKIVECIEAVEGKKPENNTEDKEY